MEPSEAIRTGPVDLKRETESITDQRRVLGMLEGLRANRALLSAQVARGGPWYNTALLKVDAGDGSVFLDELAPADGHAQVVAGSTLRVVGVLHGVPTEFFTTVRTVGEEKGIGFYRSSLPESVDYRQRRAHFRAYVGRHSRRRVELITDDGVEVSGHLLDISLGGFGALFPDKSALSSLDLLTVRTLELPGSDPITCGAEVRYLQEEYNERVLRAGFRFMDLHPQAERTLLRAILSLERGQIQRQART